MYFHAFHTPQSLKSTAIMSSCPDPVAGLSACVYIQLSVITLAITAILLHMITGLFQRWWKKEIHPKLINHSATHREAGEDHGHLSRTAWAKTGLEGVYKDIPSVG